MRLAEFVRKALEFRLSAVRVAVPVEVVSYDVTANTVDVKPLIKDVLEAEDGIQVDELPVLTSVPVAHPRGGGFFVAVPIAQGDTGHIVACDRSIDEWHKKGGQVTPLDRRLHTHAGAIFYPGVSDSTNPIADASATDLVIGEEGGSLIVMKPGGQVEIGGAPTEYVALATKTKTELDALAANFATVKATLSTHVHPTAATGPPSPPTPPGDLSTFTPHTPASVAAAKVKAD